MKRPADQVASSSCPQGPEMQRPGAGRSAAGSPPSLWICCDPLDRVASSSCPQGPEMQRPADRVASMPSGGPSDISNLGSPNYDLWPKAHLSIKKTHFFRWWAASVTWRDEIGR